MISDLGKESHVQDKRQCVFKTKEGLNVTLKTGTIVAEQVHI